jgi:hypothetical protein
MSSNYAVMDGIWRNHSNKGWYAASLTLDVHTGAILIAGLATFITIVSARFWVIIAFAFHQLRATRDKRDAIHHQQQAIYRNTSTQLGVVWLLLQVSWAWRGLAQRNALRLLVFGFPPLLCFIAFTAASLLSARITAPVYTGNEVRVRPKNCGLFSLRRSEDMRPNVTFGQSEYSRWVLGKTREATNYARTCNRNANTALTGCNVFPVTGLPYKTRIDAPCPFKGNRCVLGENGAFELTTMWIDSHRHLGVNAVPANRIRMRRVTTCSVLRVDDLVHSFQIPGANLYMYSLGNRDSMAGSVVPAIDGSNYTFQYRDSARRDNLGYAIQ